MNTAAHNKIVSFIWSIADDGLHDVYVRGKYRDVILPMKVLRRLDALLELLSYNELRASSSRPDQIREGFQRWKPFFLFWDGLYKIIIPFLILV